jgi:ABC-type phosphate transport system substrate-binding protein
MRFTSVSRSWVIAAAATLFAFAGARDSAATERRPDISGRDEGFLVVVNEQNTVAPMPRALVSRLFLKKVTHWESGPPALPVDLPADSPVRDAFTRRVLAKSVGSVKAYWQQQIFSGRDVPPPEKPGDDAVIEFVKANTAAIAYVSPGASLPRGVRVLGVID